MTTERDEPDLDDLFAAARGLRPDPSADLVARILADAEAVARARQAAARPAAAPQGQGWFAAALRALGGWPALGGLAASASLGLVLGVAQPAGLSAVVASIWGDPVSVAIAADEDPLSVLDATPLEG